MFKKLILSIALVAISTVVFAAKGGDPGKPTDGNGKGTPAGGVVNNDTKTKGRTGKLDGNGNVVTSPPNENSNTGQPGTGPSPS